MEELAYFIFINELLTIYGKTLTPKQQEIMEAYYRYNLGVQEIATNLSISKAGVSDAIKVSIKHLENLESIVGHYAYKKAVSQKFKKIKEMTNDEEIISLIAKEEDDGI